MSRLYTPPQGFYDLPFTWCYDASGLTPGVPYPNQYVYLKGGYGDFIMRRVLGMSRIMNPTTGQYQIYDNSSNPLHAFPVFGASADDIGMAPETRYMETGAIKFDLNNVTLPGVPTTGQVCFQGVRRMKGNPPQNPNYQAKPKTYCYAQLIAPVNPPIGSYVRVWQPITDYDFELYQIILLQSTVSAGPDSVTYVDENHNGEVFTAASASPVTIAYTAGTSPFPPVVISVAGTTVTISGVSGSGVGNDSIGALIAAIAANPAAAALLKVTLIGTPTLNFTVGAAGTSDTLSGSSTAGVLSALTTPISSLWLYDSNKVQVSSAPMVDIYMDGGPGGVYKNGAIVTPLWYPQNSQIQIDVYSQLATGTAMLAIYLVGRQWFPC
jgi:hypothetical protein